MTNDLPEKDPQQNSSQVSSAELSSQETVGDPKEKNVPVEGEQKTSDVVIKKEDVWDALRLVYDPEVPISIVDMGLVYDVVIEGKKVIIKMTLTVPGCMMGPSIAGDAQTRVLSLPGVEEAQVEIVWDPPWHIGMMSEEGRKRLGME